MTVPSSTFTEDNPGEGVGEQATANSYNVDQRTGFRVKPGALITDWTGAKTLPENADPFEQQFRVRDKAELLTGSIRPEPADNFITSISDGSTL